MGVDRENLLKCGEGDYQNEDFKRGKLTLCSIFFDKKEESFENTTTIRIKKYHVKCSFPNV